MFLDVVVGCSSLVMGERGRGGVGRLRGVVGCIVFVVVVIGLKRMMVDLRGWRKRRESYCRKDYWSWSGMRCERGGAFVSFLPCLAHSKYHK